MTLPSLFPHLQPMVTEPSPAKPAFKPRRPMTDSERFIATALLQCQFLPGSPHKGFARDIAAAASHPNPVITEAQSKYLCIMANRYRRQLAPDIVALARKIDAGRAQA